MNAVDAEKQGQDQEEHSSRVVFHVTNRRGRNEF